MLVAKFFLRNRPLPLPPKHDRLAIFRASHSPSQPTIGRALPVPPSLNTLDAIPNQCSSFNELTGQHELLALVTAAEVTMTDRLRQTLVALQETVIGSDLGTQVVALTNVSAPPCPCP